jgi:hypothetical protein
MKGACCLGIRELTPIVSGYRTKRGGGCRGFYRGKKVGPAAGFAETLAWKIRVARSPARRAKIAAATKLYKSTVAVGTCSRTCNKKLTQCEFLTNIPDAAASSVVSLTARLYQVARATSALREHDHH